MNFTPPKFANLWRLTHTERDSAYGMYCEDLQTYCSFSASDWTRLSPLFSGSLFSSLVNEGLIARTETIKDGVIKFPDIVPALRPEQLPISFRRDAAYKFLDLWVKLSENGLTLHNADLGSFSSDVYGSPYFHDFQRIVPAANKKFPYQSFFANFLGPLLLANRSPEFMDLLTRSPSTIDLNQYASLVYPRFYSLLRKWEIKNGTTIKLHRAFIGDAVSGLLHCGQITSFMMGLIEEARDQGKTRSGPPSWSRSLIAGLQKKLDQSRNVKHVLRKWIHYHEGKGIDEIVDANNDWKKHYNTPRDKAILKAVQNTAPGTLLDIGSNKGFFSYMAAHCGFNVLAVDHGMPMMDRIYQTIQGSKNRLPVRSGFLDLIAFKDEDAWRYESDVTLALSLTHHLRKVSLLPWDRIVSIFSAVTKRTLITELKVGTRVSTSELPVEGLADDYTVEIFVKELKQHFKEVIVDNTYAEAANGRTMIICHK